MPGQTPTKPPQWLQIRLATPQPEAAEQAFWDIGALAVTLSDAADQPLLEPLPGQTPLWDAVVVTGLFEGHQPADPLLEQLREALPGSDMTSARTELLEDRQWVREWMTHFQPLRCGERLWICPTHHAVHEDHAIVLKLDPGLAFGTGSHPTTALCLRWLDQADLSGKTVIDYGCGSGILAVAAALLGADKVWAIDIDPQAIEATRSNAKLNKVDDRIIAGPASGLPDGLQADLVIANILAAPLIQLAPNLVSHLRKPGQIVLAGLLAEQSAEIVTAYSQDIALQTIFSHDGWQLLAGESACPTA